MFFSILNSEKKIMIENVSESCFEYVDFQMTICNKEMPYSAHWKSNKQLKQFGCQASYEYSAD